MKPILVAIPEFYEAYRNWVSSNPQLASDCESTAKWISYFLVGKINNSHVLSELVYCLSNLLALFNDRIINNVRRLEVPNSADKLKLWLTVVEYCEVFFELSVDKFWGRTGKWVLVVSIQVFKCIARLLLIYEHKERIIQVPPIPPVNRGAVARGQLNNNDSVADLAQAQFEQISFTLDSGKVIRRVETAPPLTVRNWKPLKRREHGEENLQTIEEALAGRQLVAETIYVAKPLAHLVSLACFGQSSWKPYLVALAMDAVSLQLYGSCKNARVSSLTQQQRMQISKRTLLMLMYLLRSPFYDKHSKDKLNSLLYSLGKNVPLARIISGPLLQYLPFWQSNYFYMWSS